MQYYLKKSSKLQYETVIDTLPQLTIIQDMLIWRQDRILNKQQYKTFKQSARYKF